MYVLVMMTKMKKSKCFVVERSASKSTYVFGFVGFRRLRRHVSVGHAFCGIELLLSVQFFQFLNFTFQSCILLLQLSQSLVVLVHHLFLKFFWVVTTRNTRNVSATYVVWIYDLWNIYTSYEREEEKRERERVKPHTHHTRVLCDNIHSMHICI